MELFSPVIVGILVLLIAAVAGAIIYPLVRQARRQKAAQTSRGSQPLDTAPTGMETKKVEQRLDGNLSPLALAALSMARPLMVAAAIAASALLLLAFLPNVWFESFVRVVKPSQTGEAAEPLWLESMGEERTPEQIRVYGTVRNVAARDLIQPRVVVKFFGLDGGLLDTVAAPFKEALLGPQARTEFSVIYQRNSTQISRYVISFTNPQGAPLVHKDIRGQH